MSRYVYSLSDYRSVKRAVIDINGITILVGENGTGKSTISRLLYDTTKVLTEFDRLVELNAVHGLQNALRRIARPDIDLRLSLGPGTLNTFDFLEAYEGGMPLADIFDASEELIGKFKRTLLNYFSKADHPSRMKVRLQSMFGIPNQNSDNYEGLIDIICSTLEARVNSLRDSVARKLTERNIATFYELMSEVDEQIRESKIDTCISEDGLDLVNKNSISSLINIDRVVYYKTYELLECEKSNNDIYKYLNTADTEKIDNCGRDITLKLNAILNGGIQVERDILVNKLYYSRNDGLKIPLNQAATGAISFSILAKLLENGHLHRGTLLIVDEPEAHLHPKWIVEYARILVLLQKSLDVKIVLSSHNPDMIAAIDAIARKEEISGKVSFYFAVPSPDDSFQYVFEKQDSIANIFDSFNFAITRIQEYGKEE